MSTNLKIGNKVRLLQEVPGNCQDNSIETITILKDAEGTVIDLNYNDYDSDYIEVAFRTEVEQDSISFSKVFTAKIPFKKEQLFLKSLEMPETKLKPAASYRLSFFGVKKGRNRPATNMFQMAATELSKIKNEPSWVLDPDGAFGHGTDKVARAIQKAYNLDPVDGIIGKGTWRAITPDLGSWRAPLRFRIAECQCTFESGTRGYGFHGVIPYEGWQNYGIWNVNKGSARILLDMGGAGHLISKIESDPDEVASWFGSKKGRETQVGKYFLEQTLKPSLRNLEAVGFDLRNFGIKNIYDLKKAEDFPVSLADPFYERLLTLACDITINSGAGGFFPTKSPRQWQSQGELAWPDEKLPFRKECMKVFEEEFKGTIKDDYTYLTSKTRETYKNALKRCLRELCKTNEQRIALIAELQSRCIIGQWRDMVIRRRRCVAWPEGHVFQGSFYSLREHFGIGI